MRAIVLSDELQAVVPASVEHHCELRNGETCLGEKCQPVSLHPRADLHSLPLFGSQSSRSNDQASPYLSSFSHTHSVSRPLLVLLPRFLLVSHQVDRGIVEDRRRDGATPCRHRIPQLLAIQFDHFPWCVLPGKETCKSIVGSDWGHASPHTAERRWFEEVPSDVLAMRLRMCSGG